MANSPDNQTRLRRPWWTPELLLVLAMLAVLLVLVALIMLVPASSLVGSAGYGGNAPPLTGEDILNYRTNILSIILTAFGAWVGAGAAYFFGRENLRVAADSLLAMRDLSPRERLRRTFVRDIPPAPLEWKIKETDALQTVKDKFLTDAKLWFVPIVSADETLKTVLHREVVLQYLIENADLTGKTVADVLKYRDGKPNLERLRKIYVEIAGDTNLGAANDLMQTSEVFLAVVLTEKKPTHYLTTADVRKILLAE